MFEEMPCNIISKIYEFDDTYKILFNNVIKELDDIYNEKKDNKLKKFIVKILKNEWYNDEYIDYLWPRVDFNIIIKAMKDEIINNPIIFKHIKFIFRSLCHYNNSDGLDLFRKDDKNMRPFREVDNNNEYNDNDTLKTIKIQISNFLKDIIDDSKLEQFLYDFIDDDNFTLDSYLLSDKYDDFKQDVNEEYNTKNIFKNYEYKNQPHLYNYKTEKFGKNTDEFYINYNKILLEKAEQLYIIKNGLCNNTIQIRYDYNKVPNEKLYHYELLHY
jgi:hypothetical protein